MTETKNLPDGLYELTQDVETTINRDLRVARDWRKAGKWKAGLRFEISTNHEGHRALWCLDQRYRFDIPIWASPDANWPESQLASFLLDYLAPYAPPTIWEAWSIINYQSTAGLTILYTLVERGKITEAEAVSLVMEWHAGKLKEVGEVGDG